MEGLAVFDANGALCFDDFGDIVYSAGVNLKARYDSDAEAAIARMYTSRKEWAGAIDSLTSYLKAKSFWDLMINSWFVPPTKQESYGAYLNGTEGLQSSGDHTWSILGITGGGSFHFNTKVNLSSAITDINNFSIFLYISSGIDGGTDYGASDGTNAVTISTMSGGTTSIQVGTATDSFSTTDNSGCWWLRCSGGNFQTYQNGQAVGSSTAIAGSLPNFQTFLGAYSNSGTGTDYAQNTYSFLSIYNGSLTEDEGIGITEHIEYLQAKFYRGYAISR